MVNQQLPTSDSGQQSLTALKQSGIYIAGAIVLALAAYFGWNYYQSQSNTVDTTAADAYVTIERRHNELNMAAQNSDLDEEAKKGLEAQRVALNKDIDALISNHGDTIYAWQALMLQARQLVEEENYAQAASALEKALAIDLQDSGLQALTRLRYASALLGAGDLEGALTQASMEVHEAFEATKQELLGDIYKLQGDQDKAVRAYENAWSILLKRNEERAILKLKMEHMGLTPEPLPEVTPVVSQPTADLTQSNLALKQNTTVQNDTAAKTEVEKTDSKEVNEIAQEENMLEPAETEITKNVNVDKNISKDINIKTTDEESE